MYNTIFFARKSVIHTKTGKSEKFVDIYANIKAVMMFGSGPYYRIVLRENNESGLSQYYGWKDFKYKSYDMIYPLEEAVKMCFPYGIEAEEKAGHGKLIGFIVESYEELT
ncbi:hypothetical protein HYX19_04135 [Candidatus Woesearchaeota archaeon]|nr:hypothetical protein [Candidatus Woesearchaeota archaeon]